MATVPHFLSLERFDGLYAGQKPHVEYWFGEAISKQMPTYLHGVVQWVLAMLLDRLNWKVATEVRLKLSDLAQPVPDLIADARRLQGPYPSEPFDLCVEILSPGDDLRKVFQKAAHYLDWGIGHVRIIDPELRKAHAMSRKFPVPAEVKGTLIAEGASISLEALFAEVDRVLPN